VVAHCSIETSWFPVSNSMQNVSNTKFLEVHVEEKLTDHRGFLKILQK